MKKIALLFVAIMLVGAGCAGSSSDPTQGLESHAVERVPNAPVYQNAEYGFQLDHLVFMQMNEIQPEKQMKNYLGQQMKLIATLIDKTDSNNPETLMNIYVIDEMSVEDFSEVLVASDPEFVQILSTDTYEQGGLAITKMINSTESTIEKTHYLFDKGNYLIVISEFLGINSILDPTTRTFRSF